MRAELWMNPADPSLKKEQRIKEKQEQMTDTTEDLELFDNASNEFPSKFDLKDRLVAIWPTGRHGIEKGTDKPYEWIETITVALDDPKGVQDWNEMVKNKDKDWVPTLVPSVVRNGPQRLDNLRWSTTGTVARLKPRIDMKDPKTNAPVYRPLIGRIDERQAKQGSNPWTIVPATADEQQYVIKNFAELIREITIEVKGKREGTGSDENAFD